MAVTDAVCLEHLDIEYADLCRRVVGKLGRKRPSPLLRGAPADLGLDPGPGHTHALHRDKYDRIARLLNALNPADPLP